MDSTGLTLVQNALVRCLKMPSEIGSLRSVLDAGVERAAEVLGEQDQLFVKEFMATEDLFKDRAAFEAVLPQEKLVAFLTEQKVRNARIAVNAADLVFTHGTVDGVAFDCCRAITLIEPDRCRGWVEDRTFKMGEILAEPQEALLRRALDSRLEWLERRSLPDKADFLYRTCPPPAGWKQPTSYTYDRDRLARVDEVRHRIVHDSLSAISALQEGDGHFLEQTGLHLVLLAVRAFRVILDPETLLRSFTMG